MSLENMITPVSEHVTTPANEHEIRHISHGQTVQHEQELGTSPAPTDNTFLAGYIDCAQEALWYLTQVEQLPLDHPTVIGLQMHLWEQYKMLHLQQLLGNKLHMCNESESVITDENTNIQQNNLPVDSKCNKELTSAIDSERHGDLGNSAIKPEVCNTKDHEIPQTELRPIKHDNVDQTDCELSPEAQQMAEALAEEIYSLLNAEHDLDEYDSGDEQTDNECESSDEGFEEMTES